MDRTKVSGTFDVGSIPAGARWDWRLACFRQTKRTDTVRVTEKQLASSAQAGYDTRV